MLHPSIPLPPLEQRVDAERDPRACTSAVEHARSLLVRLSPIECVPELNECLPWRVRGSHEEVRRDEESPLLQGPCTRAHERDVGGLEYGGCYRYDRRIIERLQRDAEDLLCEATRAARLFGEDEDADGGARVALPQARANEFVCPRRGRSRLQRADGLLDEAIVCDEERVARSEPERVVVTGSREGVNRGRVAPVVDQAAPEGAEPVRSPTTMSARTASWGSRYPLSSRARNCWVTPASM